MTSPARDQPFDPGLQVERTLLAWRRTCLALAVGNAVAIRYLIEALGPFAAVLGVPGLVLSIVALLLCTWRYRRVHAGLVADAVLRADGLLPLLIAGSVGLAGVSAFVIVVVLWHPW